MTNLPEPVRSTSPAVNPQLMMRAAVSPVSVAVVAVGVVIGVLAGSWVLAVVLAIIGWSGRMGLAALAARRREEAARPRPAQIDPWSVPEPWRPLVQQVADAQHRFDQVVADWPPGPLKERLQAMQPQVWSDVGALGAMARRGASMTGWNGATRGSARPRVDALSEELRRVAAERAALGPGSEGERETLDRREEALAAQLRSTRASEQAADQLLDRLRGAAARLDGTVTDLLTLGGAGSGSGDVLSSLREVSEEVAALRAAVAETSGPPPGAVTP